MPVTLQQPRHIQRTRSYRETKANVLSNLFLGAVSLTLVVALFQGGTAWYASSGVVDPLRQSHIRKLLECEDEAPSFGDTFPDEPYEIDGADYPSDLFSQNQLQSGAIILHFFGLMYMFLAIAIVCDEFFVPAIEQIVDALNLTPDVAGATFMAAGGSAPELFTAFIGTFVSKSDVGFGTIVGSAVFNVLFVIGCCAVFSSGDLVLTWYPFARDSIYYCVSLCLLAGFFSDSIILWWEALILLLMYGGYVTLMFNNAKLYGWIDQKFIKTPEKKRSQTAADQLRPSRAIQTFSVSLFKMMTADADISEIAGAHMVTAIKGDVKATFYEVDTDGNGTIGRDELKAVLQKLGGKVTEEEVDKCYQELDENDDGQIDFEEFKHWYLRSENRIEADVLQIFNRYDRDYNGYIEIDELASLMTACQGDANADPPSTAEVENARKMLDTDNDGQISKEEFMSWYKNSKFFMQRKRRADTLVEQEESEEEAGVSLAFPSAENWKGRIMYVITAPIMYTLYFTVPDVRKKRWSACWPMGFIGSITWLGIYSYLMVWWATVLGKIIGIPDGIMGLTLLAAGTSVPDLITSVILAREGKGDMAVSSSIGSNIFDVLVGLPLPWIFAAAINFDGGAPGLKVVADSLFGSIFILFGMLGAVLTIIYCSKWRMTKALGYSMFVLYILFCIQDIVRQVLSGAFSQKPSC